jgi:hypothetical protein
MVVRRKFLLSLALAALIAALFAGPERIQEFFFPAPGVPGEQLEQLYARHARREIAAEAVLIERARIFGSAERTFGWQRRAMKNVGLANEMTYSRHYPLLEMVHEALGGDLVKTIAFFKQVDPLKPTAATVMQAERISDQQSIAFVRAYETVMAQTVKKLLADYTGKAATGQLK